MSKFELQTCSQSFVWVSLPECAIIFHLVASRTLFLCPVLYFCTNVVFHSVSEFCTHLCLAYHHNQIRGYHCILVIYYLYTCFHCCNWLLTGPYLQCCIYSAANKGRSAVNYRQSLAFDCQFLSCNDHCDQWFFQEIFIIIIIS